MRRRTVDPAVRQERRRFWWRVVRNTVIFSGVAAAVGWSVAFRQNYGSWPFLDIGDRITWCGQDYKQSVTDLTTPEVLRANQDRQVEHLFAYPPQLAKQNVLGVRMPQGCTDRIYIRTAPDRYTEFLAPAARE